MLVPYYYNFHYFQSSDAIRESTEETSSSLPVFGNLMSAIIRQNQLQTGDSETNITRMCAQGALDHYLNLPVLAAKKGSEKPDSMSDTFLFWKSYMQSPDKAQRKLCEIARHFLSPPPTSTGNI